MMSTAKKKKKEDSFGRRMEMLKTNDNKVKELDDE